MNTDKVNEFCFDFTFQNFFINFVLNLARLVEWSAFWFHFHILEIKIITKNLKLYIVVNVQVTLEMGKPALTSMNVRSLKVNLNQDTTATATPTAQIPLEVTSASVEMDSLAMVLLAEVSLIAASLRDTTGKG